MTEVVIRSIDEAIAELGKLGGSAWDNGEPCPVAGYVFVRRTACPERFKWRAAANVNVIALERKRDAERRAWCVEHLDDGGREIIKSDYPELMPLMKRAPKQLLRRIRDLAAENAMLREKASTPLLSGECGTEDGDQFYFSIFGNGLHFEHIRHGCDGRSVQVTPEDEAKLLDVLLKRSQRRFVEMRPISEYPCPDERAGRRFVVIWESDGGGIGAINYDETENTDRTDRAFFEVTQELRDCFKTEGNSGE